MKPTKSTMTVLKQVVELIPAYLGRKYVGFPRRFKRVINVVDSTTIKLVANCMDWVKHRRRKAAAKCHMRLDLQTFLPRFALESSRCTLLTTEDTSFPTFTSNTRSTK